MINSFVSFVLNAKSIRICFSCLKVRYLAVISKSIIIEEDFSGHVTNDKLKRTRGTASCVRERFKSWIKNTKLFINGQ